MLKQWNLGSELTQKVGNRFYNLIDKVFKIYSNLPNSKYELVDCFFYAEVFNTSNVIKSNPFYEIA
ncbi:hypothetical protein SAMN04488008_103449 [Maribacter orientalis]|uniref:Uncharacterized protein n=1 Tax=Maribacter orientalis TaxID=228957 RepID=A0A1H7PIT7_9FLAO|nr:hypothetical protein SAMN04488008_103449 [Maribacter orientalis]